MTNPQPLPADPRGEEVLLDRLPTDYRLSVVIPAHNEEASVGLVVTRLRQLKPAAEIIVVDDGSTDATAEQALAAGAKVLRQPYNKGNGAAVKAGIRAASGEVILIIDADGQHSPDDINKLLDLITSYDLVVGARTRASETRLIRDLGNGIFNRFASYMVDRPVPDLTSGFRAMRRDKIMDFIHLLPNGYSHTSTSTIAFIKAGYNVTFVPFVSRKDKGKSGISWFRDGWRFMLIITRLTMLFTPMKVFLPISLLFFLVGLVYAVANIIFDRLRIPNGAVLLISVAVIVFLIGLVSEQIAALRLERRAN